MGTGEVGWGGRDQEVCGEWEQEGLAGVGRARRDGVGRAKPVSAAEDGYFAMNTPAGYFVVSVIVLW